MKSPIQFMSLALAAAAVSLPAVPAAAADFQIPGYHPSAVETDTWERYRSDRRGRDYERRYQGRYAYGEPVHRNTRVWRGNDGRRYCEKKHGTTGLIVGGAVGALLGRGIDGRYNRSTGTILGAAAGALPGQEIAGGTRCR